MADGNSQGSSTLTWLVLTVLAALGIAVPVLPKVGGPKSPPPVASPAAGSDAKDRPDTTSEIATSALDIVADYYGVSVDDSPRNQEETVDRIEKLNDQIFCKLRIHPRLGFVIATVPDPVESHLQISFDLYVSSIQLACQRHGYVLDRYSFPWQRDVKELQRSWKIVPEYMQKPGVLLFRPYAESEEENPNDLLIVLLVGETPISGVHRQAFHNALKIVNNFKQGGFAPAARGGAEKLLILGPANSGSGESLAQGIQRWYRSPDAPDSCVNVQLVSGSALAIGADTFHWKPGQTPPGLTCSFRATVLPGAVLTEVLIDHLNHVLGIPEWKIAQVFESGTGYGAASGRNVEQAHPDVLTLTFPVEVGRLRSEYERNPELRFSAPKSQDQHPARALRLTLEEPPLARDTVPTYSSLGPALTERRLQTMFEAISRRGIMAVIVNATDPRDLLFVAKQIHDHCPDVQLCNTSDNHLLFTHPDCIDTFRGMLTVSTYPLFLDTQTWMKRQKQYQFSSTSSQGVNNAMSALLHYVVTPRKPQTLLDFELPFSKNGAAFVSGPPAWVSVVGDDGFWPVHAYTRHSLPRVSVQDHSYALRVKLVDGTTGATSRVEDRSSEPTIVLEDDTPGSSSLGGLIANRQGVMVESASVPTLQQQIDDYLFVDRSSIYAAAATLRQPTSPRHVAIIAAIRDDLHRQSSAAKEHTDFTSEAERIEKRFGFVPSPLYAVLGGLVCLLAGVVMAAGNRRATKRFAWTSCGAMLQYVLANRLLFRLRNRLRWVRTYERQASEHWQRSPSSVYASLLFAALLAILLLVSFPPILAMLWWIGDGQPNTWLAISILMFIIACELILAPVFLAKLAATSDQEEDRRPLQRDNPGLKVIQKRGLRVALLLLIASVVIYMLVGKTLIIVGPQADQIADVIVGVEFALVSIAAMVLAAINFARDPYAQTAAAHSPEQVVRAKRDLYANESGRKVVRAIAEDCVALFFAVLVMLSLTGYTAYGITRFTREFTPRLVLVFSALGLAVSLVGWPFKKIVAVNGSIKAPTWYEVWRNLLDKLRHFPIWILGPLVIAAMLGGLCLSAEMGTMRLQLAMAAKRYGTYSSGVSPLLPLLLIFLMLACWSLMHLRRVWHARRGPACHWPNRFSSSVSNELSTTLDETLDRLREFTLRQLNTRDATIVVLSGALLVYILFFCWIPTIEGPHFDLIVKAAFIASLGLLLELFLRVRLASAGFQAFLDTLEEHAVAPAFGIIPERFKRRASLYYLSPSIPKAERDELNASKERLSTAFVATEKPVTQRNQQLPSRVVQSRRIDKERGHLYDESLVVTLDRMLKNRVWNRRVPLPLAEHERYQFNANVWDLENWSTEAQRFLAMRLSLVIRDVFVQLRNLLIALVVLLLLFVWLLHSYPFRPQSLLTIFSYGVVLYVVITLALRFAAFNRNGVLSMMAGTEGNRLSWDRSFIVPMLIYVVVPLLGLLALQFPTLGSVLSDWATDLQQAFKN